ncbi:MAG: DUF4198 domain-containing protein [Phycisphaerae bacterium]|nr:DUF4198 domain-containing protein [Phycisphaerae bacterium]
MLRRTVFALMLIIVVVTPVAMGHFHVLVPQEYEQWSARRGRPVACRLVWGHGYEHIWMDATRPAELTAIAPDGQRVDLLANLKPTKVRAADGKDYAAFEFAYTPAMRGDHTLALKAALLWDDKDEVFLQDYAKSVLHVQDKINWDCRAGHAFELVPLTRPYGLQRGHVMRMLVLHEGKPLAGCLVEFEKLQPTIPDASKLPGEEFITFEARSDVNGIVAFGLHDEGWFALTAIHETDTKIDRDGHTGPLVERATFWIHVAPRTGIE